MLRLTLSPQQLQVCKDTLTFTQRWLCGDTMCFYDLAADDRLVDHDGKSLDLGKWLDTVEPTLMQFNALATGGHLGEVREVFDPGVLDLARTAERLSHHFLNATFSNRESSIAAWPLTHSFKKVSADKYDLYSGAWDKCQKVSKGLSSLELLKVAAPLPDNKLVVNIEEADVCPLMSMLDSYSRVLMCQWHSIMKLSESYMYNQYHLDRTELENMLGAVKEKWTGFSANASHGIFNEKLHPSTREVWCIYKAIRHLDSVGRNGYNGSSVANDGPGSGEVLPLVENMEAMLFDTLPVGGGVIVEGNQFFAVSVFPDVSIKPTVLAWSYSLMPLLASLPHVGLVASVGISF